MNRSFATSCVDPELVLLLNVRLLRLLFLIDLARDLEFIAKLFVSRTQRLNQVKVLVAVVAEDFATRPNVPCEVVVEEQREGFLFLKLPIESAR